jgi:hypothetical protein
LGIPQESDSRAIGIKQLQTMLQKYAEILEMMAPKKDEAAN